MTQLDVMYRYGGSPAEAAMMALGCVREVYGIRRMTINETEKTVRIEYDATRLTEPIVHQLLRRSGLKIIGQVSLIPLPPASSITPPAAA
jgi:hypothetical protein